MLGDPVCIRLYLFISGKQLAAVHRLSGIRCQCSIADTAEFFAAELKCCRIFGFITEHNFLTISTQLHQTQCPLCQTIVDGGDCCGVTGNIICIFSDNFISG